ncbi:MAG: EMC3/TMCO1 family protein [Nanoarchaeota archaeon]
MDKKGSFKLIFLVMILSIVIAGLWNSIPAIKNSVHAILDPSAGKLLNWNVTYGMLIAVFIITLISTLVQKYGTNQAEIRRLKKEQKDINERAKQLKDNPEKMMEVQKELMPLTGELMKHSMRPLIFTAVPFVLFFRWFADYFAIMPDFKFFGFFSWFWFYLLSAIIISMILRKFLKVE